MSRERARRREERERASEAARSARARRDQRLARRRARTESLRARLPRRTRWRRQQGLLARRRRIENGVIAGLFLAVQAIVWLVTPDPWVRGAAALLGLLALPVLVTLALDRRSGP
jgi:Flp pilus assembly protein TadB